MHEQPCEFCQIILTKITKLSYKREDIWIREEKFMKNYTEIVGKQVKDMYGSLMGKVVGVITDIDGSVQFVGISGYDGIRQAPFEQMVVQNDSVIFIPRWRFDSQKLIREKNMILRRLKSILEILEDNDGYKQDAEIAHSKYEEKLQMLSRTQDGVKAMLVARLDELENQAKMLKLLSFDAKVQHKSDELSEDSFETVKIQTGTLLEHIAHETAEITDIQRRLEDLDMEVAHVLEAPRTPPAPAPETYSPPEKAAPKEDEYSPSVPKRNLDQSASNYLSASKSPMSEPDSSYAPSEKDVEDKLPMVPTDIVANDVTKVQEAEPIHSEPAKDTKTDWLARMESQ